MLIVRIGMVRPIAGSLNTESATFYDGDATGEAMGRDNYVSDYNICDNKW